MAARDSERYYWLKLDRGFFKRHDIAILEGMPGGKQMVLFYLKLMVESIDHEGMLRFSDTLPYSLSKKNSEGAVLNYIACSFIGQQTYKYGALQRYIDSNNTFKDSGGVNFKDEDIKAVRAGHTATAPFAQNVKYGFKVFAIVGYSPAYCHVSHGEPHFLHSSLYVLSNIILYLSTREHKTLYRSLKWVWYPIVVRVGVDLRYIDLRDNLFWFFVDSERLKYRVRR